MEIIEKGGHNELCGGYSYSYEITFGKYGNTLKDVLKEIKEYTNEHSFGRLGDFGNPDVDISGRHWGIYVNGDIYISSWIGEGQRPSKQKSYKSFYKGDESEIVTSIYGDGGWYCGINIHINTTPISSNYTDSDFLVDMPYSN